jgi:hypothetical protein
LVLLFARESAATDAKSILLPNISRKETGRPLRQIGRSDGHGDVTINFLIEYNEIPISLAKVMKDRFR